MPAPATPSPPSSTFEPRHRWLRGFVILCIAVVCLVTVGVIAIQIVLMTDFPRRTAVSLLERETGLNVEAKSLVTGWAGHTVLRNVVFRIPLDQTPIITADTVVVDHSDLVRLVLGGFSLTSLKLDGAVIDAYQDDRSQWSILRAIDAVRRSQGPGPSRGSAANLPAISLSNATLRVSRPSRTPVALHITFEGKAESALTWAFAAAVGESHVSGRITPGGWAHEVDASIAGIEPILSLWTDAPPRPATATLHWSGELTNSGLAGRLVIDSLAVGSTSVSGDVAVSASAGGMTLRPGTLHVASPMLTAGPLVLSRGTVSSSLESVTFSHVRAELPGLVTQLAGTYDIDADSATATFAWSGSLAGQAIRYHGAGQLAAKFPQVGRRSVQVSLDTDADAGPQHYHAVLSAKAAGITWDSLDGSVSVPDLFITGFGDPIDLSGLKLAFADRWPSVTLLDLVVPGAEVTRSIAAVNLATREWQADLDAGGVTVHQLGHEPLSISLRSGGDFRHVDVSRLTLASPSVEVAGTGSLVPSRDEPLQAHADITARLAAPPPKASDAAFKNPARDETGARPIEQPAGLVRAALDIGGQVSPVRLHGQGRLHAENVRAGAETLPPIDVGARALVDPSGGQLQTDAFPLFDGQWTLAAWYRLQTREAEAHLDAAHVSLNRIVHTVQPSVLMGGDLGAHLDLRVPELDYRRAQLDGTWEVNNLEAGGATFPHGGGGISVQNGRVELRDININQGPGGRASLTGQVAFQATDPRHVYIDMASHRWPLALRDSGLHALVDTHAQLDVDVVLPSAQGTLLLTADAALQQKDLGTITALTEVHGRTLDIRQFAADILGGTVTGRAHIPLDRWTESTASMRIQGVNLDNLGELAKSMGDLRGEISGSINAFPTNDPEALEPLRAEAALTIKNGAQRGMHFGDMSLVGYAGPDRLMLDRSTIQVADGVATVWARLTWHDTEPFVHVSLQADDMSLDQLVRAADPTIGQTPGVVNGRAAFGGYVYQPHRSYGEAEFNLKEADLGRFPVMTQLYGLLNLGQKGAGGRGLVRLRLEGDTLQLERLHYYNRGADIIANGAVQNIWLWKDSAVAGIAAAAMRPLKGSKLPFGRDLDRMLRAVFVNAASVSVEGTVGQRTVKVVPFADAATAIDRLLGNGPSD